MAMKARNLVLVLLLFLTLLPGLARATAAAPQAASIAALDEAECQVIVSPPDSIQDAIDDAANDTTICVREGTYHEALSIPTSKTGLRLVAYPGESPILDGQKRLPYSVPINTNAALVEIDGIGTVFDGFEVRFSSSRGVDVNNDNITVRNSSVHDNWSAGITIRGGTAQNPASNVLIENNLVYSNLRRGRHMPVIYRGDRVGTGAADWQFDPDVYWDTPFWSGSHTDLPDGELGAISLTFNDDGRTSRIYIGSTRNDVGNNAGHISDEFSASGQPITYSGRDLLFFDPATNKWTLYFNGETLGLGGNAHIGTVIDAFQIDGSIPPDNLPCPKCAPIVMSFRAAVTLTIDGVATPIGPSDLVRFSPTAVNEADVITAGAFMMEKTAAEMGLPDGANIDALDRTPDGAQLMSFATDVVLSVEPGTLTARDEDLVLYGGPGVWTHYFDGEAIPLNPFSVDLTAAWLDRNGHIYISGDPVGGSALVFIFAEDGVARGNTIYNNYGEGLVAGRFTSGITLEDNIAFDNDHANVYLNDTINPLVQRNIVFCTDNREFWRKGNATTYRPGLGITIRDEDFNPMPPPSSGQIIINNIAAGCNTNFSVGSQRPDGGLRNGLIANNVFVNGRADVAQPVSNIVFGGNGALYENSYFVNNLIVQTVPGELVDVQGIADFSTMVVANNLYSSSPPSGWFPGEAGRVVGNPQFAGGIPPLPVMGTIPDPADYRLSYSSPAFDAGQFVADVMADYFDAPRNAGPLDIGAHELPYAAAIVVVQEALPEQSGQTFDYEAGYASGGFALGDDQRHESGPLPPGSYDVTVADVPGWTTTATCDDGSPPDDIDLGPTETVTCTFTSTRETRLTVSNTVEPSAGAPLFDFVLTPGQAFQLGHDSRTFIVTPDVAHNLTATPPAGWERVGATCDNGDAPDALTLTPGEWVICTFSHGRQGRIVIAKQTLPAGAADVFAFTADFDADGFTVTTAQPHTSAYLSPGSYSVAETPANGWVLSGATCDDGSLPNAIDLAAGETVTCTFVNSRAELSLTKTPAPASLVAPGGDVSFAVQVNNDGGAEMTVTGLSDSVYGDVADAGNAALIATTCALPQSVAAGDAYTCAFTAHVGGAAGERHDNTLTATADGPGNTPLSATAEATVTITAPSSGRIVVIKQTNPPNTPGSFAFTADFGSGSFSLSHGQSHDSGQIAPGDYAVSETVPAGWTQIGASCDNGDGPGDITLAVGQTVTCIFVNQPSPNEAEDVIYVTTNKAGKVRGMAYSAGDILAYDRAANNWSMVFDGSDVGLKTAISDFELLPDGSILLALKARTVLNTGAARFTLEAQDVARFTPTSLGTTTAGSFALHLDGSDVGLTTAGEAIDALARLGDGRLLISTAGSASVPDGGGALSVRDEDLLAFTVESLGANTAGTWQRHFRGADVPGLAAENLTAAWVDAATNNLYVAVANTFIIGGLKGNQQTVLVITPARAVAVYWNAKNAGFAGAVDGLFIEH